MYHDREGASLEAEKGEAALHPLQKNKKGEGSGTGSRETQTG